jgi:hypothetical protein
VKVELLFSVVIVNCMVGELKEKRKNKLLNRRRKANPSRAQGKH